MFAVKFRFAGICNEAVRMGCVFFPQYRKSRSGIEAFQNTILGHARSPAFERTKTNEREPDCPYLVAEKMYF